MATPRMTDDRPPTTGVADRPVASISVDRARTCDVLGRDRAVYRSVSYDNQPTLVRTSSPADDLPVVHSSRSAAAIWLLWRELVAQVAGNVIGAVLHSRLQL